MTDKAPQAVPRSVTSVFPALCVLLFAVGMLYWAQDYSPTARRFPSTVAAALILFAVIDLWSRTRLPGRRLISAFWGTEFNRREMAHNPAPGSTTFWFSVPR